MDEKEAISKDEVQVEKTKVETKGQRVEEKGFLDQPTKLPIGVSNLKKASEKIYQVEDSTSSTSLDISLTSSPLECEGADIIDALFELRSVLLCEVCRFSSLFLADSGGRCFVENLANVE
ncbi:hypothetical protein V6N11_054637 [Hibiscus sabdariffa]|uniref:Uncharacterized protein n=1 Tax=Hibiscus sabdariffa TaxID=183260 RepID=A0ABR2S4M2_9ROSI